MYVDLFAYRFVSANIGYSNNTHLCSSPKMCTPNRASSFSKKLFFSTLSFVVFLFFYCIVIFSRSLPPQQQGVRNREAGKDGFVACQ